MLTVPLNLFLCTVAGASAVVAARRTVVAESVWTSTSMRAVFLFALFVMMPAGAHLLWRYPDWSLMYLVAPRHLPMAPALLAMLYPMAAMFGFGVARSLLRRYGFRAVLVMLAATAVLMFSVLASSLHRLLNVGTTEVFADKGPPTPLLQTPLWYLLLVFCPVVASAWALTLWRLFLLSPGNTWSGQEPRGEPVTEPAHAANGAFSPSARADTEDVTSPPAVVPPPLPGVGARSGNPWDEPPTDRKPVVVGAGGLGGAAAGAGGAARDAVAPLVPPPSRDVAAAALRVRSGLVADSNESPAKATSASGPSDKGGNGD